MDKVTLKLTGQSPVLMHSDRGANPLDPAAKELKKLTGKRKKTDEDHAAIARLEWELGMYIDPKLGPYLPTQNIQKAIVEGGRINKLGTAVERAVLILADRAPLAYKGPRDPEGMWKAGGFADMRSVVVGQARTMRCRPIFAEWSTEVEVLFDTSVLDRAQLVLCAENAGRLIGLGDYRPRFGRFAAEALS